MLFAGGCAPRKGVHLALDAWLQSSAPTRGTFTIAGGFIPGYAERLAAQLAHPSVKVVGHRNDLPDLMRNSDILILPSLEEGSALVTWKRAAAGVFCWFPTRPAPFAVMRKMRWFMRRAT